MHNSSKSHNIKHSAANFVWYYDFLNQSNVEYKSVSMFQVQFNLISDSKGEMLSIVEDATKCSGTPIIHPYLPDIRAK